MPQLYKKPILKAPIMSKKIESGDRLTREAYDQAVKVLRHCNSPLGIRASARERGYTQVWARDSMISLLGASFVKDKVIRNGLKNSLITLLSYQTDLGLIPNNVEVKSKKSNFQAYIDGGLWFIIGQAAFFKMYKDYAFLKRSYPGISKTLKWYQYQDVDQSGFISMQEAADWEDLFATRGKGLYTNLLYYQALKAGAEIAHHLQDGKNKKLYAAQARRIKTLINKRFWYSPQKAIFEIISDSFGTEIFTEDRILPSKSILKKESYYLPYISARDFGEWFDILGNLLAILTGVADKRQTETIFEFIDKFKLAMPYPIKAIHPPILPGGKDWKYYYKFGDLNLPHQYHNGGIWPFLGGFYVAALVEMKKYSEARKMLVLLARANKHGKEIQWEFNEWLHGKSGKPMGMIEQAWSAGMYIYAYECVRRRKVPFF